MSLNNQSNKPNKKGNKGKRERKKRRKRKSLKNKKIKTKAIQIKIYKTISQMIQIFSKMKTMTIFWINWCKKITCCKIQINNSTICKNSKKSLKKTTHQTHRIWMTWKENKLLLCQSKKKFSFFLDLSNSIILKQFRLNSDSTRNLFSNNLPNKESLSF